MALSGSSSPHFYLARSRSTSLPPLSSTKDRASASASSSSWPFQALPCLGLAFDDPSFFADLRVDINPIPSRDTSRQKETEKKSDPSTSTITSTGEEKDKDKLADDSAGPPNPPPDHHHQPDTSATREGSSGSDDCVWVHRVVLAVHSPVFRSLLRPGGSRESRESAIDMRGPQHPPGVVVRCMLKMMYSSPGLAIDELDKETKLSEEWEFLLQLFKLAHLYQVEVALDACTRRLKHILERKSDHCAQRQHRQRSPREDEDKSGGGGWGSEEDDERTKQTCYALELLAFLLHVREAESMRDGGELDSVDTLASGSGGGAKSVSADELGGKKDRKGSTRRGEDSSDDVSVREGAVNVSKKECGRVAVMEEEQAMMTATVNMGERREDLLVRMLDGHLYPQLPMIVQHIRCEDVLTLQHLLRLSVCRPSPSSPPCVASLTHSWSGARTSHVRPYNA